MAKRKVNNIEDLENVYKLMKKYKVNYTKTHDFEVTINQENHETQGPQEHTTIIGFKTLNHE